jgi:type VI secretion system protein ImpF
MTSPRNDRLAPPLMYAFRAAHEKRDARQKLDLRDEGGDRVIAARRVSTRGPISESGLRREVMIDLINLLNSTNLDAAEDLSATPAVMKSILNYGFPDLASRTLDENGVRDVAREIEVALGDFEPRLARDSIRASRDMAIRDDELRVRFVVKADLRARPVNVPVEFVAEVDLESGKIKVDRA